MFVKCPCQHCNKSIEFEADELAEENSIIPCPHCAAETKLFVPEIPTPQKTTTPNVGIFLQVQDERRGPYAKSQVQSMWNNGLITLDARYWHEGMSDWGEIEDFFAEDSNHLPNPKVVAQTTPSMPPALGANVANLIELAKAAATANNPKEAYAYYSKVLEFDPKNSSVWAGKAEAAGWMSSLTHVQTVEMISAFNNAIGFADENEKPALRKQAADVINRVTSTCFGMSKKHMLQYIKLGNTWVEHVELCRLLISALEVGHLYDPENKTTIENLIHISKSNLEGYSYSPDGLGLLSKKFSVTPHYEAILRAKVDEYSAKVS